MANSVLCDCVLLALIFEISRARRSAQVSWRCYLRPWFIGALGAPGSTLACLMSSEWDRPPSVTEGVGNPSAEQKHQQHHHTNTTTVASESDIFKITVQVEDRTWSDAHFP